MARTPQPNTLKVLHGTRRSRLNGPEAPTRDGPVEPPSWLSEQAEPIFDELLATVSPAMLAPCDAVPVAMLAEALADYRALRDLVRADPLVGDGHGQRRRNPLAILCEGAASRVERWSRELAMSPSARARLTQVTGATAERELRADRLLT